MSLIDLAQRRLLIVTGKGGVGKSTLTAALGRTLAKQGKRVLLAEIVPLPDTPSALAHALGDAKPTEEPTPVAQNLWVTLLTPSMGHRRFLQDSLPLRVLADAAMRSQAIRKFLSAAPGFSDMGVMYRMLDLMKRQHVSGQPSFEVCIVDSPATGHALALAQIPGFLARVIPAGPIARAAREGVRLLTDERSTGTLIVTLPETLPVTEALDLERGLERHRLPIAAIVVNRVPKDPFSPDERRAIFDLLDSKRASVFGARELHRIERAEAALKLLKEQHPERTVILTEVAGTGATATAQLMQQL